MNTVHIINHSHLDPAWRWLEPYFAGSATTWSHYSAECAPRLLRLPVAGVAAVRFLTAWRAVADALTHPHPLMVSHGPRPAWYAARIAQWRRSAAFPHLAFSFNFTTLPDGVRRREMIRAYRSIDRFTVFSTMERTLYADYFDLDPARIDMLHWAVEPEDPARLPPPPIAGRYLCAVGSQGRDYRVLLEAARRLPDIPLHLVVHPVNLHGLDIPPHVTVHTSIPYPVAASIVAHSAGMALPLLHHQVPCGHVTAVMAMHLGRLIIATDSLGLHDYLRQGETACLVEPANPSALADALARWWADPVGAQALGERARAFARTHCTEAQTVAYFRAYLQQRMGVSV